MVGKSLLILSALSLAAVPGAAETRGDAVVSGSQADLNVHSDDYGYHPGRRSFYNYPRHRHVDGGRADPGDNASPAYGSAGTSLCYDNSHGSAYYGRDYGAPYFGGGYYDRGVYYRERRDR
jgi:hypothetical protein